MNKLRNLFFDICKLRVQAIENKNVDEEMFLDKVLETFELNDYSIKQCGLPDMRLIIKSTMKNRKIDPRSLKCHKNICFSLMSDKELKNKDTKRAKRFREQRISRGFDDSETWSLDQTIASFILPRMKRFKKISCAFPMSKDSKNDMTQAKWNSYLDKMIESFELIIENRWSENIDFEIARKENDERIKKIESGLYLFAEWFIGMGW